MKQALVIGPGRWGSFIAWYVDSLGVSTTLLGREKSEKLKALQAGGNGVLSLPRVRLSSDFQEIKKHTRIFISVPAQNLRGLLEEIKEFLLPESILIFNMKGIEIETGKTLTQVAREILPSLRTAVWLGPGHPQELVQGIPNCMVIDSREEEVKEELVEALSSPLIRFYYGQDLLGNEIGAAYKNVIGIAAGLLDGLGLTTLKGALMSRGCREVSRLIEAMGGDPRSAYGLCHLGDYEATVFSKYSNNRRFGELWARQEPFKKLAEGTKTSRAILRLEEKMGLDLPVNRAVVQILYEKLDPKDALEGLFARSLKQEF